MDAWIFFYKLEQVLGNHESVKISSIIKNKNRELLLGYNNALGCCVAEANSSDYPAVSQFSRTRDLRKISDNFISVENFVCPKKNIICISCYYYYFFSLQKYQNGQ